MTADRNYRPARTPETNPYHPACPGWLRVLHGIVVAATYQSIADLPDYEAMHGAR